jgi:glutathione S-transferase
MKLYDYWESGNAYKVRMLLSQVGESYERVHLDILKGETRTEEFAAVNPNHRVPVLELDDGRRIAESNAILFFLAEGTPFLPDNRWERALVLQWMFFEQYSHEPYIAVVRFWHFSGTLDDHREELPGKMARGCEALEVMEKHLRERPFFVDDRYTIADIALYAYTHVAHEGGFDLKPYEAINAWLDRVRLQPRHVELADGRPLGS